MGNYAIGIDFGTSVVKATAIDLISSHRIQRVDTYASNDERSSPDGWTAVLLRVLKEIVCAIEPSAHIESLAITAMVPNVAIVSGTGNTLGHLLFCDDDAFGIEVELDQRLNSPRWANEVLSKQIFLTNSIPIADYRWYTTHNWLVHYLTGRFVLDSVSAGECGSLVSPEGTWNYGLIEEFGLSANSFPEIVAPATIVGQVRSTFQIERLVGVPVAAGTSDTVATALGAGWADIRNTLLIYYGTYNCAALIYKGRSEVLTSARAENPFDWVLSVPRAGDQVAQIANLVGDGSTLSERLESLERLANSSVPGANGLVFLHAEDLDRTTVSSRPSATLRYLEPKHTRGDLARAIFEGFGYLLRRAIGYDPDLGAQRTAISSGGGAKSVLWRQIVSDVTGTRQLYRAAADRGLGSAMLAAFALDPLSVNGIEGYLKEESQLTIPNLDNTYENYYLRYLESWISNVSLSAS